MRAPGGSVQPGFGLLAALRPRPDLRLVVVSVHDEPQLAG
jgi:hypothetical protein